MSTRSPSVTYGDSSLPEGALHKFHLRRFFFDYFPGSSWRRPLPNLTYPSVLPIPQGKLSVFNPLFKSFAGGWGSLFKGFPKRVPSVSHLHGRCVGHDALTGMAGEKQALSAVFRILGEHLKNIFRSGIIDLRKNLVKEQGRLFVSVKH